MSTILEALSKASREQPGHHATKRLIMSDGPYVLPEAPLDQAQVREASHHRWFWIGFGATAGAALVVGLLLAALRPGASGGNNRSDLAAAGNPGSDSKAMAGQARPGALSEAKADAGAIVIPPNLEEGDEGLPHPFSDPAPKPTAPAIQSAPAPTVVLPQESPVPLAEPPRLPPAVAPAASSERPGPPGAKSSREALSPPKADPMPFQLGGIIWDESCPMALVNRECVQEGDRVGDAEVVAIGPSSVELNVNGKKVVLGN